MTSLPHRHLERHQPSPRERPTDHVGLVVEANRSSRRYNMHPNRWRGRPAQILTGTAAAAFLLAASAGCSDSEADPIPEASTSVSPSQTPTTTPVKTGGPPAGWEKKFTQRQLNTYDAALARWTRFSELNDSIYQKGKNTRQARAALREYDLFSQRNIKILGETFDKGGVRQVGSAEAQWSYAKTVKTNRVVLIQCLDYSNLRYTKRGKVMRNRPKHLVTPLVVRMTKPDDRNWMFESSTLKDKTSCTA